MLKSGSYLIFGANSLGRKATLLQIKNDLVGSSSEASFDVIVIGGEETLGIDQIRNLQSQLKFKPQKNLKLVIIENAQLSTPEAQNALLKTIEEPSPNTVILLGANAQTDLLPTVVSRCQKIFVGDQESPQLGREEQEELLSQNAIVVNGNLSEKFGLAQGISTRAKPWLETESLFFRDLLFVKTKVSPVNFNLVETGLKKIAENIELDDIIAFLKTVSKIREAITKNANSRFALEILFLESPRVALSSSGMVK